MPFQLVNDIRVYGLGSPSGMWFLQVPRLAKAFRTIVFDNRGVGRSDKPDEKYSVALMAAACGRRGIMAEPIMTRTRGEGVEIQMAIWEGAGKQVLCVHGLTANCRCWDLIACALVPKHRVLALDLRGRGLSDKPPTGYSVNHHARDIHCLMEDLGLDRLMLMGHSLGAYISLAFAAQHPERVQGLVLIDGGAQLTQERWNAIGVAIKPSLDRLGQVFPSFDAYLEVMKQAPFLQPWSPVLDTYFRYEVEALEEGVRSRIQAAHIEEEVLNLKEVEAAGFYSRIRCPVLILRATDGILTQDDLVLPETAVQRMVREIPNARRVDVAGSNHFSILLQPNEQRDRAITGFLAA
jgi:pimeloyl-ACP methyl ester carboxylesterase